MSSIHEIGYTKIADNNLCFITKKLFMYTAIDTHLSFYFRLRITWLYSNDINVINYRSYSPFIDRAACNWTTFCLGEVDRSLNSSGQWTLDTSCNTTAFVWSGNASLHSMNATEWI